MTNKFTHDIHIKVDADLFRRWQSLGSKAYGLRTIKMRKKVEEVCVELATFIKQEGLDRPTAERVEPPCE